MRTLKYCITGISAMILSNVSEAQFTSGSLFIVKANTPVIIDSFHLEPAVDLQLVNTDITNSYTAVPATTPGDFSITRVTSVTPPMNFRGDAGLLYANSELNGNTAALLNLVYHDGVGGYFTTNLLTTSTLNNNVEGTTGVNTITLGKITAVDAGVVLPLQLLSFDAKKSNTVVNLNWVTTSEKNVARFDVERSIDNTSFLHLSSQKAKGNGSIEELTYVDIDKSPVTGWNYYRLKIVDNNSASYSQVVALHFDGSGNTLAIYPNPVKEQVNISFYSDRSYTTECKVNDITGKLIKQQTLEVRKGDNLFSIDMQYVASGNYMLLLDNGLVSKITKE